MRWVGVALKEFSGMYRLQRRCLRPTRRPIPLPPIGRVLQINWRGGCVDVVVDVADDAAVVEDVDDAAVVVAHVAVVAAAAAAAVAAAADAFHPPCKLQPDAPQMQVPYLPIHECQSPDQLKKPMKKLTKCCR